MNIIQEKKEVKWFIQKVLIENIGHLIKTGNHYLGFGLIAQGIELLGAIIEDEDIEKLQKNSESDFVTKNKSRRRFHHGIKLLQNSNYHLYCPEFIEDKNYDLYKNLRCGFAHVMRPQGLIGLTSERESIEGNWKHLEIEIHTKQLILVSEIFYNDFKNVCEKVIEMIDNNEINHKKAYGNFLALTKYK